MRRVIKILSIIIGTYFLFKIGQTAAYAERGYKAVGGEYCLLLFPFLYYIGKNTAREFKEALQELSEEAPE